MRVAIHDANIEANTGRAFEAETDAGTAVGQPCRRAFPKARICSEELGIHPNDLVEVRG